MKIKSIVLALIVLVILSSCGETNGVKSAPGGESLIDFDLIPFQQTQDGKWGYCDINGNVVIDTFLKVKPTYFKEGYAIAIKLNGKYDYLDKSGKLAGKEYLGATMFSDGLAAVSEENQPPYYINQKFEKVFALDSAKIAGMFSEGYAKFQDENGKWGFIDKSGSTVVSPNFDYAANFSGGLAVFSNVSEGKESIGYINKSGKTAINLGDSVAYAGDFRNGRAVYADSSGWGVIDEKGNKLLSGMKNWKRIGEYIGDYSTFLNDKDKWGLIDRDGKIIIEATYDNNLIFAWGLAPVQLGDKWGFIDIQGEIVIKPVFEAVYIPFFKETALVQKDGKIIFIGMDGEPVGDKEFLNVNLQYDLLINKDQFVKSEKFNPNFLISKIVEDLNQVSFNGMSYKTTVMDIVNKYRINYKDLFKETNKIGLQRQQITEDLSGNILFEFSENVTNKNAKLTEIEITFNIGRKYSDKVNKIYESLVDKIKSAGFSLIKNDENINSVFESSNMSVNLMQMHALLILRLSFNPEV